MRFVFAATTLAQVLLGLWRARLVGASVLPPLTLAAVIALIGVLWFAKEGDRSGAPLARFVALLSATIGVLSAISAANAPFIGNVARISTPLFAFSTAAVLMTAGHARRVQAAAAVTFVIAFAILELDLMRDAWWEAGHR